MIRRRRLLSAPVTSSRLKPVAPPSAASRPAGLPPVRPFPYRDGDTLVLGPEIFAALDGSVLCWRGTNYVRQETRS